MPLIHPLIHDWNAGEASGAPAVMLDDETLRDGLQSPSVRDAGDRGEARICHLMDELGIDTADIGLPGAGPHVVARRRAPGARDRRAAADDRAPTARRGRVDRRHPADRRRSRSGPACRSSAARSSARARSASTPRAGRSTFLQRPPRRRSASRSKRRPAGDVRHRGHDARRSRRRCARSYTTAIRAGASRLCIADTVGHATPEGARAWSASSRERGRRAGGERRHRLARPPRPRLRRRQRARGVGGGRDPAARHGARHRRARAATRRSTCCWSTWSCCGCDRARSVDAAELLRGGLARRAACRSRPTIRWSAATRSAPPPASTPRRSSRRSGRTIAR